MELKAIRLAPEWEQAALDFLKEQTAEHPELADAALHKWQRADRFVVIHENRVVGYVGQIPQEFHGADRRLFKFGFGTALQPDMTHGDEIRKASGRALLHVLENNDPWKFAGAGMIPSVIPVYERRGHTIKRNDVRMYARLFRPGRVLQYFQSKATWSHWRRGALIALPIHTANLVMRLRTGYRNIETIESFRDSWDSIWEKYLSEQYELFGVRNAGYLNHKLAQPKREYCSAVHKSGDGTVDGYIVFRIARHPKGVLNLLKICDVVGSSEAKLELISFANSRAAGENLDGVTAMSSQRDQRLFRRAGLFVARPYSILLPKGVDNEVHVSFFDSDLDNLW